MRQTKREQALAAWTSMHLLFAAPASDWSDQIAIILTIVGAPLILIGVPIYLLSGGLKSFGLRALERCLEGVHIHERPEPGDVQFQYHTYRGFLLWVVQSEHFVSAAPADAERLLGRLLRYNLTWGLLSYGMLFIPILACGNYLVQQRSIRQQSARSDHPQGPTSPP